MLAWLVCALARTAIASEVETGIVVSMMDVDRFNVDGLAKVDFHMAVAYALGGGAAPPDVSEVEAKGDANEAFLSFRVRARRVRNRERYLVRTNEPRAQVETALTVAAFSARMVEIVGDGSLQSQIDIATSSVLHAAQINVEKSVGEISDSTAAVGSGGSSKAPSTDAGLAVGLTILFLFVAGGAAYGFRRKRKPMPGFSSASASFGSGNAGGNTVDMDTTEDEEGIELDARPDAAVV